MDEDRNYDALAAKLAEVTASSQGWIDAAVEQQVRRKKAEARILEVEAERDAFASNIPDAAQNLIRNAHIGRLKALHRAVVVEAELAEVEEERGDALIALASARKQLELYIEEGSVMAQKLDAAEARIAHLENHIEGVAKDTHKIMVAYEAALPAVYRLGLEDAGLTCEQLAEIELALSVANPPYEEGYSDAASVCFENIRALPTPTAAELMARIQTGEKE